LQNDDDYDEDDETDRESEKGNKEVSSFLIPSYKQYTV
jgi:hypothetical protein